MNPTPQVAYLTNDHLGSARINTDENGAVISRHDYRPYGEEITERTHAHYVGDTIRKQFTSYERDAETDLDYAQARMYRNKLARFTAVDPTLLSARTINPQTLNRFAFVLNNPLIFVDPLGLWALDYEPEYAKHKDGTFNTHKVKTIKVFFRKSKDTDTAESLLSQLGFSSKDNGYEKMKSQIEGSMQKMGEMGIQASSLDGKVDGVEIGNVFKEIGNLLGEQANYDVENSQRPDGPNGPSNPRYNDCSMTAAVLAGYGSQIPLGTQGPESPTPPWSTSASDTSLIPSMNNPISGRVGDMVRYGFHFNKAEHFATVIFTGDDGIAKVFSRSGHNGRFEVLPIQGLDPYSRRSLNGYGSIMPKTNKQTGIYRR